MRKPELVIIDLDGTLLRGDQTVGERTLEAIARARDRGVMITFATGRMVSASRKYLRLLGIDLPMVALNGALVKGDREDESDVVYHAPVPEDSFHAMFDAIAESRATVSVVKIDRTFGWNINPEISKKLSAWIVNITEVEPEYAPSEPTIVMVAGDEEPVRETYEAVKSINPDGIDYFIFPSIRYYPMWYLEIRGKGVHKGSGVRALREKLGIPREKTMVIGDFINDLPMFEEAGIRAAVANAHQDIIDMSDYVSPYSCDQDGVADIIEKVILS